MVHRVSAPGDADPLRLVPVPGGADPVAPCGDRGGWCRYRGVPARLDSARIGRSSVGTGRCLPAPTVHESAPLRLSPVPRAPAEWPCVSWQRAGAGRCLHRSSRRCHSRHRCPGGRADACARRRVRHRNGGSGFGLPQSGTRRPRRFGVKTTCFGVGGGSAAGSGPGGSRWLR